MVGLKVDEGEGARMKVREVDAGGLKLKMRGGGKPAVQQVHEDVLHRLGRLVLTAHLHEQLLGEDVLHQLPGLRRDFFKCPSVSTQMRQPRHTPALMRGAKRR